MNYMDENMDVVEAVAGDTNAINDAIATNCIDFLSANPNLYQLPAPDSILISDCVSNAHTLLDTTQSNLADMVSNLSCSNLAKNYIKDVVMILANAFFSI